MDIWVARVRDVLFFFRNGLSLVWLVISVGGDGDGVCGMFVVCMPKNA